MHQQTYERITCWSNTECRIELVFDLCVVSLLFDWNESKKKQMENKLKFDQKWNGSRQEMKRGERVRARVIKIGIGISPVEVHLNQMRKAHVEGIISKVIKGKCLPVF